MKKAKTLGIDFRKVNGNLNVLKFDEPLTFGAHLYGRRIAYSDEGAPYWQRKRASLCRCGILSCEKCRDAFDVWVQDQVQTVFKEDIANLCYVTFRLPAECGDYDFVRSGRDLLINFLDDHDGRHKWIGVVDPRIDKWTGINSYEDWALYCLLITSARCFDEFANVKKAIEDWPTFSQAQIAIWPQDQSSVVEDPNDKSVYPVGYAMWCRNVKLHMPKKTKLRVASEEYLPRGMHSERIFFANLPGVEQRQGNM